MQKTALDLINAALHNEAYPPIDASRWGELYELLRKQSVHCLPSYDTGALGISDEDELKYTAIAGLNLRRFHSIMNEQRRAIKCLNDAGVKVVVIKGAAAAMNYPRPELRCMGDIDLLVGRGDFEKAYHALKNAGYESEQTLERYDRRHIGFKTKTTEIELHERFSVGEATQRGSALDEYVLNGIESLRTVKVSAYTIPALPPLENGLVLLEHMNQHLSCGLGMRQIIDWMMFVERELDEELWNGGFLKCARDTGLYRLAIGVTAMCEKYLGLKTSIPFVCEDKTLPDTLLEYIMNHGNFGIADRTGAKSARILRSLKSPWATLRRAQSIGADTWKLLDKMPFLKPFAWIYQLSVWIKRAKIQKVSLRTIDSSAERERREHELLKQLGVSDTF